MSNTLSCISTMGLFLETKNYVFQGFAVSIDIILKVGILWKGLEIEA